MFTKEAIEALQEAKSIAIAAGAMQASEDTKELVALPSDYKLHDLEPYLATRRRARGTMATSSLLAFGAYTKLHAEAGTSVFVNPAAMEAVAVLNLGAPDAPGHADNRAKLIPVRTAAYGALLAHAGGVALSQLKAAELLEDWPEHIRCFNAAGEITAPKAIAAVRKLTIESMRKLESSEQQLSASRSAFESVQATSTDPLPTTIYFECAPYADLEKRLFVLRLGVQTGGDKPAIALRIVNAERHGEEMAQELAARIAAMFEDESIPVLLGDYSAGK